VVRRPLISPHPDPDGSLNLAKGQTHHPVIPAHPGPDHDASRNPAVGHSHRNLDPTHVHSKLQDDTHANQEPELIRRDSRAHHPGGMGVEWAREQAARTAQEVAEHLAKEQRRAGREARKAVEERLGAAAAGAAEHHRRTNDDPHYRHHHRRHATTSRSVG